MAVAAKVRRHGQDVQNPNGDMPSLAAHCDIVLRAQRASGNWFCRGAACLKPITLHICLGVDQEQAGKEGVGLVSAERLGQYLRPSDAADDCSIEKT
jgi:hypothetical protein